MDESHGVLVAKQNQLDSPDWMMGLTVRAAEGRLSALSIFLCKSILYGAFVWARRALNS